MSGQSREISAETLENLSYATGRDIETAKAEGKAYLRIGPMTYTAELPGKHTLHDLRALAVERGGYVDSRTYEGVALLIVDGKETGDWAVVSAFGGAA